MNFEKLVDTARDGQIEKIRIHRNPDNLSQWFVMITTRDSASHILIDEQESPMTSMSIEGMTNILKRAGLKSAEVSF